MPEAGTVTRGEDERSRTPRTLEPAPFDLTDRTILVTGGSRGIGRAVAVELGRAGASVVVGYRRDADAAGETVRLVRDTGADALAVAGDVARPDDVDRLVTEAHRWHGRLGGVVTAAGIYRGDAIDGVGRDEWDSVVGTNLEGTFRVVQAAAPYLRLERGAAVVTVSSIFGHRAGPGGAAYQASKAGVDHLTRALAWELAPEIRVNGVAPGFIRTDLNEATWRDARYGPMVAQATPLGRWGEPDDIAPLVRYLLSDAAGWVTGAMVPVDGGQELR